jgi:hypothetical protein
MTRLPKSDLFLLPQGASSSATGPAAPPRRPRPDTAPAASTPQPATPAPLKRSSSSAQAQGVPGHADLRFELARALPALWAKAQRDFADGRAEREKEKLRELILWLLGKKCADVRQRQSLNFQHDGRRTTGQVDVVAYPPGHAPLALEMDWAYAAKSLEKLQAAHRQGWHVMWVCGAKMDKAAARALRERANTQFGPTYGWLFMFHLEHGWL